MSGQKYNPLKDAEEGSYTKILELVAAKIQPPAKSTGKKSTPEEIAKRREARRKIRRCMEDVLKHILIYIPGSEMSCAALVSINHNKNYRKAFAIDLRAFLMHIASNNTDTESDYEAGLEMIRNAFLSSCMFSHTLGDYKTSFHSFENISEHTSQCQKYIRDNYIKGSLLENDLQRFIYRTDTALGSDRSYQWSWNTAVHTSREESSDAVLFWIYLAAGVVTGLAGFRSLCTAGELYYAMTPQAIQQSAKYVVGGSAALSAIRKGTTALIEDGTVASVAKGVAEGAIEGAADAVISLASAPVQVAVAIGKGVADAEVPQLELINFISFFVHRVLADILEPMMGPSGVNLKS